jgi:hypothetical protein
VLATVVQYDVPGFLREDPAVEERRDAIVGVGYQYFFLRHLDGLFAGVLVSATHTTFARPATQHEHTTWTWRATLRVGWMVTPFRSAPGFFVAPWIGANVAIDPERFAIDGVPVERRLFGVTGAIQIGHRFAF